MSKKLLREKDVAEALNISLPTLRRWRAAVSGPPFVKIGASVRYVSDDVDEWVRTLPHNNKGEAINAGQ